MVEVFHKVPAAFCAMIQVSIYRKTKKMCVQETPGVSQPSALLHDSTHLPKFPFNQKIFYQQRFQKYLT